MKQLAIFGFIPLSMKIPPPPRSKADDGQVIPFPFVTVNPFNVPDVELPVEKITTAFVVVPLMMVLLIVELSLVVM